MRIVVLTVGRCRFLEENESGLRFRRSAIWRFTEWTTPYNRPSNNNSYECDQDHFVWAAVGLKGFNKHRLYSNSHLKEFTQGLSRFIQLQISHFLPAFKLGSSKSLFYLLRKLSQFRFPQWAKINQFFSSKSIFDKRSSLAQFYKIMCLRKKGIPYYGFFQRIKF